MTQNTSRPSPSGASRRRRGFIRIAVAGAAVLLIAAGGIYAVTRGGGSSASMRAVSNLDMGRVSKGSFEITTTAMGELEARNQIELRSQLDAAAGILEIVSEGSVVKKGDLLVRLNAETLQDQIDQQEIEVERAQADVTAAQNALEIQKSQNESGIRAGELKIQLAELALNQWREGEVVKTRTSQQLEIDQAQADLDRLSAFAQRSQSLWEAGFLSKDTLDQDKMAEDKANARAQIAKLDKATYEEYQHPRDEKTKLSDLEEAQADLERIKFQNEINLSAKQASLDTTKRQFDLKVEKLEKQKQQVDLATMVAPTDGLVVYATSVGRGRDMVMIGGDGPLQVGRQVRPNEQLLILPDTTRMVANVKVHESLAGRIRPGQPAIVKVDAVTNESFRGTVESIGVLAETGGWRDPNRREYSVRIAIEHDNSDGQLKPSMRAEAEIMLGAVKDSLMVPVQAVFAEGPVRYVLTPKGGRFERTPVQVGRMSDAFAEISKGLEEGQQVLLREPAAGEVVATAWSPEALKAVGVAVDDDGKPVASKGLTSADMLQMAPPAQMPAGVQMIPGGDAAANPRPQRTGEGGQRPDGAGRANGAGQPRRGGRDGSQPNSGAATPGAQATPPAPETAKETVQEAAKETAKEASKD
ncbi:MAG: efflux RND transporter periplasmic adaptor subunit [Phycisphaerales bacterium]|nr:efflux RND transporter periplasmic adaptor subunit [Phycisphaerales bacterium]